MHLFIKTLLSPGQCKVHEVDEDMETMTDTNTVTIQLFNDHGDPYYLDSTLTSEALMQLLEVSLVFNSNDNQLLTDYPHFSGSMVKGTKDAMDKSTDKDG
jgi:hypothetical protein